MDYGLYPLYCQQPGEYCRPDAVYLGNYPLKWKAKCPVCGRWSVLREKPTGKPTNALRGHV